MMSEDVTRGPASSFDGVAARFDGIELADHPIPNWWKWLFVASLALCFPFFGYYHFGAPGRSTEDGYSFALSQNAQMQFAEIGELNADPVTLVSFLDEPDWLSVGKSVYRANCAQCHGADGGGVVGPNLTDDYYKNVRQIEDIVAVIGNGASGGAMPPWQGRLSSNELILTACYVASLRGTPPAGSAKGPEGKLIPEWPTLAEAEASAAERVSEEEAEAVPPEEQETRVSTG